ncbi:MAG: response regulator transcription factor [Actinobacteria bacterium]|nr:MAG: response regulator transcription factor [Actinomycetota bacterium]
MNPLTAYRTRAEQQPQQSVRVLVVDDQPLFAEAISVLLKLNEGIEVVGTAADGQEAVDRAIALEPDLVLMDIQMPRLDGIAATRRIRRRLPHTKILMMTALTGDEYVEQALQAGAEACVRKFSHAGDLLTAIEEIAGRALQAA